MSKDNPATAVHSLRTRLGLCWKERDCKPGLSQEMGSAQAFPKY